MSVVRGTLSESGGASAPSSGRLTFCLMPTDRGMIAVAVQMDLTRIIINETSDSHIIFLKEVDGERMFPIVIGFFEASSIERRVKNQSTQRP